MPICVLVIGNACADQSKNGLLAVCEQSEAVADEEYAVDRSKRDATSHNYVITNRQIQLQNVLRNTIEAKTQP